MDIAVVPSSPMLAALIAVVILLISLFGSAYGCGVVASRIVGLSRYRLYDVVAHGSLGQKSIVFAGSCVGPLLVCCALFFSSEYFGGKSFSSNVVDVRRGGPAQLAGVEDGDRVLEVDGVATPTFDGVRSGIRRGTGPHVLTVERNGQRMPIQVTPNEAGAVGIEARMEFRRASLAESLKAGVAEPFLVWKALAVAGHEKVELAGPVAIVSHVRNAPGPSVWGYVRMLGLLGSVWCLAVPGVFLNEWITWVLSGRKERVAQVAPGTADLRVLRVIRLRLALLITLGMLVLWLLWAALEEWVPGISNSLVTVVFMSAFPAMYVIVWLMCRELYGVGKSVAVVALMFIPLANVLVVIWQVFEAKRWLKRHVASEQTVTAV